MFSAPTAEVTKLAEVYFNHASWQLTQEDGQLAIADVTFTNFRYNFLFTPFAQKLSRSKRGQARHLSCQNEFYCKRIVRYQVACAAGGTWVGVLYCFDGGAERRVGI